MCWAVVLFPQIKAVGNAFILYCRRDFAYSDHVPEIRAELWISYEE